MVGGRCVFAPKKIEPDALLTPQGALANEIAFVRNGVVSLTTVAANGEQTHVAVRGPRSLLGLEALQDKPSPAEVRAVTEVRLCTAPMHTVKGWLGPESAPKRLFELALGEVLEQRRDTDFRSGRAEARVARFVLACARHVGRGRDAPFSKARAAAILGMRPETLSRVLKKLSARGFLDASTGVRVLDADALSELAAS